MDANANEAIEVNDLEEEQGNAPAPQLELPTGIHLLDFVHESIATAIGRVPTEWLDLEEAALRRLAKPTGTDYALRTSFWREYDRAAARGGTTKIAGAQVYAGICSDSYFYNRFLRNSKKVAFLIQPVQGYKKALEGLLAQSTFRLNELLEMDISDPRDPKGKRICPRRGALLLEVVKEIQNRALGTSVQRISGKVRSENLHAHKVMGSSSAADKLVPQETVDQMAARLTALREDAATRQLPASVDPVRVVLDRVGEPAIVIKDED